MPIGIMGRPEMTQGSKMQSAQNISVAAFFFSLSALSPIQKEKRVHILAPFNAHFSLVMDS
jgi:hypothetical protein